VGDKHGNDDWLRLFNKDGTGYYGGLAAGRLWSGGATYLTGPTYTKDITASGKLNVQGGNAKVCVDGACITKGDINTFKAAKGSISQLQHDLTATTSLAQTQQKVSAENEITIANLQQELSATTSLAQTQQTLSEMNERSVAQLKQELSATKEKAKALANAQVQAQAQAHSQSLANAQALSRANASNAEAMALAAQALSQSRANAVALENANTANAQAREVNAQALTRANADSQSLAAQANAESQARANAEAQARANADAQKARANADAQKARANADAQKARANADAQKASANSGCYGANNANNCYTCDDVINAYKAKGWAYDKKNYVQCKGPEYLGCFADKGFTGISRPLMGAGRAKSKDRAVILKKCENAAKIRGHNIFAIQDNDSCFTGTEASKSYARDGVSQNCGTNRTGGVWANSVYKI